MKLDGAMPLAEHQEVTDCPCYYFAINNIILFVAQMLAQPFESSLTVSDVRSLRFYASNMLYLHQLRLLSHQLRLFYCAHCMLVLGDYQSGRQQ